MATLLPSGIPDGIQQDERNVLSALDRQLDSDWKVLHSLRWISGKRQAEGEIDLVVLHPGFGILLIEVKGGQIRMEDRRMLQFNHEAGSGHEIDPIGQLRASKARMIQLTNRIRQNGEFIPVHYAVWFPSHFLEGDLPPDLNRAITADRQDLADGALFIQNCWQFWNQTSHPITCSAETWAQVQRKLCGQFSVTPTLKSRFQEIDQEYIRLNREQIRLLDYLEDQQQAVIAGMAGTGKTLIAVEMATQLAERDDTVLLLCFNLRLGAWLQGAVKHPLVTIRPYVEYCREVLNDESVAIGDVSRLWLEKLEKGNIGFPFQHVIIDEGQDFEAGWIEIVALSVPGRFYVFYDKNQLIHRRELPDWIQQADCRLTLNRCVRSTREIAQTASRFLKFQSDLYFKYSPAGNHPVWHTVESPEESARRIEKIIQQHVVTRQAPLSDFAILTKVKDTDDDFIRLVNTLTLPVSDQIGNNSICATTIRKFKGLEARVVFLVGFTLKDFSDEHLMNLLFTGCTRATHELHLMVGKGTEDDLLAAIQFQQISGTTYLDLIAGFGVKMDIGELRVKDHKSSMM